MKVIPVMRTPLVLIEKEGTPLALTIVPSLQDNVCPWPVQVVCPWIVIALVMLSVLVQVTEQACIMIVSPKLAKLIAD